MNSSYLSKIDFGDLLLVITKITNPRKIVEFGLLDGFSLKAFADNSNDCSIEGYDIFEGFIGNSADLNKLNETFKSYKNVSIRRGDFYKSANNFEDSSIDILHVDVANDGKVYEFAINNYFRKLTQNGILLLEGGSEERDNIGWMIKYNKPRIQPILEKYKDAYDVSVVDKFPSITIIKNK